MEINHRILGYLTHLMLATSSRTSLRSDCDVHYQTLGVSSSAHPQHDLATTYLDFHGEKYKHALLIYYSVFSGNKLRGVAYDELNYCSRSHVNGGRFAVGLPFALVSQ